jgi:outer membrane protein
VNASPLKLLLAVPLMLLPAWPAYALDPTSISLPAIPVPGYGPVHLPDLLEDPLLSRPPVLDTGAVLPGDDVAVACPAQIALDQPLALNDAVDLALCNNPQLAYTWANIKAQAAAVGEARSAYLPTASLNVGHQHTLTQYPGNKFFSETSVSASTGYGSVNWRLFDFGGRAANREAANLALAAALSQHDAAMQKVLEDVVGAYFDALAAEAALGARIRTTDLARHTLDVAEHRSARGVAALSDALQAKTALAKAILDQQHADGDLRKARALLVMRMAIPAGSLIRLPDTVDTGTAPEHVDELDRWLADAEEKHPAIKAARATWESNKKKIEAARAAGLPTVDFGANYYQNGYPNQGLQPTRTNVITVGVSVTVPIFDGFATTYKVRSAEAQAEQSEAQLHDTEHQILEDVVKTHADAVTALQSLSASEDLLSAAQMAVTAAEKRYAGGVADITELLNTQTALADAEQQRVHTLADWRSARLRLLASSGLLGMKELGL